MGQTEEGGALESVKGRETNSQASWLVRGWRWAGEKPVRPSTPLPAWLLGVTSRMAPQVAVSENPAAPAEQPGSKVRGGLIRGICGMMPGRQKAPARPCLWPAGPTQTEAQAKTHPTSDIPEQRKKVSPGKSNPSVGGCGFWVTALRRGEGGQEG